MAMKAVDFTDKILKNVKEIDLDKAIDKSPLLTLQEISDIRERWGNLHQKDNDKRSDPPSLLATTEKSSFNLTELKNVMSAVVDEKLKEVKDDIKNIKESNSLKKIKTTSLNTIKVSNVTSNAAVDRSNSAIDLLKYLKLAKASDIEVNFLNQDGTRMQSFYETFSELDSCSEDSIVNICSSLKDIDETTLICLYPHFKLSSYNPSYECVNYFGESLVQKCLNKDAESFIQNYFNSVSSTYNYVDTSTSGIAGLSPSLVDKKSFTLVSNSAKQDISFIFRPANIELKSDGAKNLSLLFRKDEDIGLLSQLVERVVQSSDFSHIISNFIVLGCSVRFYFAAVYNFKICDDNSVLKTLEIFKIDATMFARFITFLSDKNFEAKDYLTTDGIKIMRALKTFNISHHCRIRYFASSSSRIYCIQLPGKDNVTYNTETVNYVVKIHTDYERFLNESFVLNKFKAYAVSVDAEIYFIKSVYFDLPIEDKSLEEFINRVNSLPPVKLHDTNDNMDKVELDLTLIKNNQIKNTRARHASPFWTLYLNLPTETSDIGVIFMNYCTNILIKNRTDYIELLEKLKKHLENLIHAAGIIHNDIRRNNIMSYNNSPILIDFDLASTEPHHIFIPTKSLQFEACGDNAKKLALRGERFTPVTSFDIDMVTKTIYELINE